MVVKLRMTYDNAQTMAQYLNAGAQWPEWEFPGLEVEFYELECDEDDDGCWENDEGFEILFEEEKKE